MAFAFLPEEILFSDLNSQKKVLMAAVIFHTTNTQKAISELDLGSKLQWPPEEIRQGLTQLVNKQLIALTPEGYISTWPGLSINTQAPLVTKIPRKTHEKIELPFPPEAHECLAIWEKFCPLHKTANPVLSLKTLTDLNKIDKLSWERIKKLVTYTASHWGAKGFMQTPSSLRGLTRAGDMPKWAYIERQMGVTAAPNETVTTSKLIPG